MGGTQANRFLHEMDMIMGNGNGMRNAHGKTYKSYLQHLLLRDVLPWKILEEIVFFGSFNYLTILLILRMIVTFFHRYHSPATPSRI